MSRCVVQRLRCPNCGVEQEEKVFVSVNGARIRTAVQRITEGNWGEVSCLACGQRYLADQPRLYSDLPGGVWLVRYPLEQRGRFSGLEAEADRIFSREFLERPPAVIREQAQAVRRRICFGREQFVEKLLALRHAIDDRALECLKLGLSRDLIGHLFMHGPWEWLTVAINEQGIDLIAVTMADQRPVHRTIVPIDAVRRIEANLQQYAGLFPELFNQLYVNASRYVTEQVRA